MFRRMTFGVLSLGLVACSDEVVGTGGPNGSAQNANADGGVIGDYDNPNATRPKEPPPVITSVAPLAGDYGTEVTITGSNLQDAELVLGSDPEPVKYHNPNVSTSDGNGVLPDQVIQSWSNTEIKFKYPFPADGAVRVTNPGGTAEGGTFVPTWAPGKGVSGNFGRKALLGAVSPAAGVNVAAFDDGSSTMLVITHPDGAAETKPLDRGNVALSQMSLYVTANGERVDGFFVRDGHLWKVEDVVGAAATSNTNVATTMAAGGEDAGGAYAWIKNGAQLQRMRAPGWTSDKSVTDPTPSGATSASFAVGADGALFVGWGVTSGGSFPFYDQVAYPVGQRLRPAMSTFDAQVTVGSGIDDVMVWTRFFPGPEARVAAYYCANDTGIFESSSIVCSNGYSGSSFSAPDPTDITDYVVGFDATTTIAASCSQSTGTLSIGPETSTADQVAALFPCPDVVAVTVDPAHNGTALVQVGQYLYAPHKR